MSILHFSSRVSLLSLSRARSHRVSSQHFQSLISSSFSSYSFAAHYKQVVFSVVLHKRNCHSSNTNNNISHNTIVSTANSDNSNESSTIAVSNHNSGGSNLFAAADTNNSLTVGSNQSLDDLLRDAHTQPGKRMEFYFALMEKNRKVFLGLVTKPDSSVLSNNQQPSSSSSSFPVSASTPALFSENDLRFIRLSIDGKEYMPFFSSTTHIKAPYFMEIEVRELFEVAVKNQTNLVMNPTTEILNKLFSHEEISALLDGSLFSDVQHVPFDSQLSIARLPIDSSSTSTSSYALRQLTTVLSGYMSQYSSIKRSWLARHGDPPMILIAVEAPKSVFDQVMGEAGPIINSVKGLPFDGIVDVFRVDLDGPSHAFLSGEYGEPFYANHEASASLQHDRDIASVASNLQRAANSAKN